MTESCQFKKNITFYETLSTRQFKLQKKFKNDVHLFENSVYIQKNSLQWVAYLVILSKMRPWRIISYFIVRGII